MCTYYTYIPGGTASHASKQIIYALFTVYFYVKPNGFRRFETHRIHGIYNARMFMVWKLKIFGVDRKIARLLSLFLSICFVLRLDFEWYTHKLNYWWMWPMLTSIVIIWSEAWVYVCACMRAFEFQWKWHSSLAIFYSYPFAHFRMVESYTEANIWQFHESVV